MLTYVAHDGSKPLNGLVAFDGGCKAVQLRNADYGKAMQLWLLLGGWRGVIGATRVVAELPSLAGLVCS